MFFGRVDCGNFKLVSVWWNFQLLLILKFFLTCSFFLIHTYYLCFSINDFLHHQDFEQDSNISSYLFNQTIPGKQQIWKKSGSQQRFTNRDRQSTSGKTKIRQLVQETGERKTRSTTGNWRSDRAIDAGVRSEVDKRKRCYRSLLSYYV